MTGWPAACSDLEVIVTHLKSNGAHLAATEQPIDTSTLTGKAFFDMLGVFAEFEKYLRQEQQAEGIVAAKRRGVYLDRPRKSIWAPSWSSRQRECRLRQSHLTWEYRGALVMKKTRWCEKEQDKAAVVSGKATSPIKHKGTTTA